tara:strand:+ start:789 stop:992 length:204 start_codon:yes stop_codon:yes gene_type:complete
MRLKIGDIAILWGAGVRRLIVDSRDEIVPAPDKHFSGYRLRTVYRLAGKEYSNHWFPEEHLSASIPR